MIRNVIVQWLYEIKNTYKDFIKIPKEYRNYIECLKINIEFNIENAPTELESVGVVLE